jgi:hypothetical protein
MFDLAPYVESWMERLGKERPLFHSESDFQLALATVMADEVEQVRLEKKVAVSERVGDGLGWRSMCSGGSVVVVSRWS